MYLRRYQSAQGYRYILRESYQEGECWKHRDLMDLGADPGSFIEYPGGNGFYFRSELEDALQARGVSYSSEELEELFLPFMHPRVRRILQLFNGHAAGKQRRAKGAGAELLRLQSGLHAFDKRRLHYLRFGRVDIGRLDGRPWGFLNVLLKKSRDEIEQTIEDMERQLRPHEFRPYIFTSFQLQDYFPNHLLRNQPAALDPDKVDDYFLDEICRLNRDRGFFRGVAEHDGRTLHPYLTKYVILYFDHPFAQNLLWNQYIAEFMRHRRAFRAPRPHREVTVQQACRELAIEPGQFAAMTRRELIRTYRSRAKELHPDRGGNHEAFIRMTEAFEVLLHKKPRQTGA